MRTFRAGVTGLALIFGLTGCTASLPQPAAAPAPQPAVAEAAQSQTVAKKASSPRIASTRATPPSDTNTATFVSVTDGDTIVTSAGKVRIIGVDTPERGQCGYDRASETISTLLASGDPVTLETAPELDDRDRYGRLLRYVITKGGVDVGLMQLEAGNAAARYDSTDGYPRHPKESAYHLAQVAGTTPAGAPIVAGCEPAVPPIDASADTDKWWLQYGSCSQLKKDTAGHPTGPFSVNNPDEAEIYNWFAHGTGHRGDGDGDGLACE